MSDTSDRLGVLEDQLTKDGKNRLLIAGLLVGLAYGAAIGMQLAESKRRREERDAGRLARQLELERLLAEYELDVEVLVEHAGIDAAEMARLVGEAGRRRLEKHFGRA